MLSLLAGQPNPSTFPITSISFSARSPSTGFGPDASETTLTMSPESVAAGLQYGATAGYAPMLEWTAALQEREHGRKEGEGWRVTMGVGSQDLIYKVCPCAGLCYVKLTYVCDVGDKRNDQPWRPNICRVTRICVRATHCFCS